MQTSANPFYRLTTPWAGPPPLLTDQLLKECRLAPSITADPGVRRSLAPLAYFARAKWANVVGLTSSGGDVMRWDEFGTFWGGAVSSFLRLGFVFFELALEL